MQRLVGGCSLWTRRGWRTYFGCGVGQAVEGGTLPRGRFAHEGDERVASHACAAVIDGAVLTRLS